MTKSLGKIKLTIFSDDKINVTIKLIFAFGTIENMVEKGENADFHLFPQCFQKNTFSGSLKVGFVW